MKELKCIFFLLLIVVGCARAQERDSIKKEWRILFVGNSLTYTNDLPRIVSAIAKQDSVTITYKSLCLPNYSLGDHLADGGMQKELKDGRYDLLIAQQGPSALPESQRILWRDAQLVAQLCAGSNTRFALFTVWPAANRLFDLDNVIASYKNAAEQTGALLCPAGLAWKNAWEIKPSLALYSFDGFHPSPTGSLLAALTIYRAISEKSNYTFLRLEVLKLPVSQEDYETLKSAVLQMKN